MLEYFADVNWWKVAAITIGVIAVVGGIILISIINMLGSIASAFVGAFTRR